ncbi:HI1506-related protein [Pseudomonas sp. P1B16]|uniref:HI1506-related protein n=1 Tax=Pseudomonas sp. P1B16 TaxID=2986074 RepID=UPI002A23E959|nr:HI1506-related protein [Pseudomonas sp. P1B16]WPM24887.1 HI1506-related protein [Pseudomonas sp. P1B16]
MGVIIKSMTDGFRRGGIAHRAEGTYYPDGVLTEQQLAMMRDDPHLLVAEGVQEDALQAEQDNIKLLRELATTIATLEYELGEVKTGRLLAITNLEDARTELEAIRSAQQVALDRQLALPGLVVEAAKLLTPADQTQEGVIFITADSLAAVIAEQLQPQQVAPEAQDDANQSTLGSAGDSESPNPSPAAAVAPADGSQAGVVNPVKAPVKRGKNAQKDAE